MRTTLPVSTETANRCFSTFKIIKTYRKHNFSGMVPQICILYIYDQY